MGDTNIIKFHICVMENEARDLAQATQVEIDELIVDHVSSDLVLASMMTLERRVRTLNTAPLTLDTQNTHTN